MTAEGLCYALELPCWFRVLQLKKRSFCAFFGLDRGGKFVLHAAQQRLQFEDAERQ
jgi:hypothetical protein